MDFDRQGFEGVVVLKQYVSDPDGNQYIAYVGKVSILSDKEMLGFEVSGQESNWVARVEGTTTSVNFPGCQVRAVHVGVVGEVRSNNYKWVS